MDWITDIQPFYSQGFKLRIQGDNMRRLPKMPA
jgi:hypothetical protein